MQCTHCKYPDSRVVHTTRRDFKNEISRRRECLRCGTRFTTYERLKGDRGTAMALREYELTGGRS